MRSKCRSTATFHRPIHSHWSLPLSLVQTVYMIQQKPLVHTRTVYSCAPSTPAACYCPLSPKVSCSSIVFLLYPPTATYVTTVPRSQPVPFLPRPLKPFLSCLTSPIAACSCLPSSKAGCSYLSREGFLFLPCNN